MLTFIEPEIDSYLHHLTGDEFFHIREIDRNESVSNLYDYEIKEICQHKLLTIFVDKYALDDGNTDILLLPLSALLYSPKTVSGLKHRIEIQFNGYNNSPDDVVSIESIQKYLIEVGKKFNLWFYFLKPDESFLQFILPLCSDAIKLENGRYQFNNDKFPDFFNYHMDCVRTLCSEYGYGNDIIAEIETSVIDHYKKNYSPNVGNEIIPFYSIPFRTLQNASYEMYKKYYNWHNGGSEDFLTRMFSNNS
jgi:hypothetical protein